VLAAKQQGKISAAGKIEVSSIAAFVAQNLDELSEFTISESASDTSTSSNLQQAR